MVHTLEPLLQQSSYWDQAHFGLWVSLGIVLILMALFFKMKYKSEKTFQ